MSELSFETSYEDEVTAEIMDWALDTMPDEVKGMSIEDIADKYWEAHLDDAPDTDAFSVLPDFDAEEPLTDLTKTYGNQPNETS
tara:strand:+ start:2853 stop:3104 length:252 start_codon:yes stop_codon:yes gene_type:complete